MSLVAREFEVRSKLADYLLGEISLEEFEDWFVPVALAMESGEASPLIDLVRNVELSMAEMSGGAWSEAELRTLLRELVETPDNPYSVSQPDASSSSPDVIRVPTFTPLAVPAG